MCLVYWDQILSNEQLTTTATTKDDIVPLAHFLIEQFHKEYREHYPAVDVEKVIRYIADHIINGRGYVVRLNNDIIGAALVKEADYWFSKETFLNEGVFYVSAKARRTPAAKLLLNELKAYARELNLPLMIGVTTGDRLKAKDKFFEMNSFKRVGGMYVLRI